MSNEILTPEDLAFTILNFLPLPFMMPGDVISLQSKIQEVIELSGQQQRAIGRAEGFDAAREKNGNYITIGNKFYRKYPTLQDYLKTMEGKEG